MSDNEVGLPTIGSKWRHITEPGVYVVTDGTLDGRVCWTEEGKTEPEWAAHVWEFRKVFTEVPRGE